MVHVSEFEYNVLCLDIISKRIREINVWNIMD